MRLGESVWPGLPGDATVVVPVGSTEQHGPHLPLDTDTRVAVALADRAVGEGVLVAPPLAFGASGEHAGFPGLLSIGHAALRAVLVELGRSADWAARLLFVNGHGGNLPTLADAVVQLRGEGRDVAWWAPGVPGGDAHAGRTETALLLALAPGLVRPGAVPGPTAPLADLLPALRAGGVAAVSPNGVLGDPTGATAEEGGRLLAALVADLRDALARWAPDARGRLR